VILHTHTLGTGDGVPVLALHGVRGHGARFRRLAEEALPGRIVLAVDLRGHGRSGYGPPWDTGTHVADVVETLDHAGVDGPVDVVAHSFGGLVALRMAAAHPGRVRRVVLLDPAAAIAPEQAAAYAAEDLAGTGRSGSWASEAEARAFWLSLRPPEGRWAADEDLAVFLVRDGDGRWRHPFSREAVITAWSEMCLPPPALDGWHGDATLVTAVRQPFVSDALRRHLRRTLGPRLREVDVDSGHIVMWDAPAATAAVVAEALGG
jgi:lipase